MGLFKAFTIEGNNVVFSCDATTSDAFFKTASSLNDAYIERVVTQSNQINANIATQPSKPQEVVTTQAQPNNISVTATPTPTPQFTAPNNTLTDAQKAITNAKNLMASLMPSGFSFGDDNNGVTGNYNYGNKPSDKKSGSVRSA